MKHPMAWIALPALIAAQATAAQTAAEPDPARQARLVRMVRQDCGSCHGLTRKGGLGSALTPDALAHADAEGLALIILDGVPGTAMPPWRPLITEEEAIWIADYLKKD